MSPLKTVHLDFSLADPSKVELLPAGFDKLAQQASSGERPGALGGFGWPPEAPVVWFVVAGEEGRMHEAAHLAVCIDEETARDVTEQIARTFADAGVAKIREAT